MSQPIPEFAAQWIQQWKDAAPRLQAIRDEELRQRSDSAARTKFPAGSTTVIFDRYPERHGLVVMQRWFLRRHLLETTRRRESASSGDRATDG